MPKNEQDTTIATREPRSRIASASRTRARTAAAGPGTKPSTEGKRAKGRAPAEAEAPVSASPSRRGRSAAAPEAEPAGAASPPVEPARRKGRRGAVASPDPEAVAVPTGVPASSATIEETASAETAPDASTATISPEEGDAAVDGAVGAGADDALMAAAEEPTTSGLGAGADTEAAADPSDSGRFADHSAASGGAAAAGEAQEGEVAAAIDAALDAVPPPATLLSCELSGPLRANVKVQEIKGVLGMVIAGLPTRLTLPVLSHVLIASEGDGHLRITATDLDTTVTRRIPAALDGGGAVLVSGKKLNEIVKELPDPCTLNISVVGEEVVLVCDATRTRFRLPTLPVDEFPSPPRVRWDEDGFSVDSAMLIEMISRTSFAVSTEETRPILNGVLWELRPAEMTMVATNGHRLSSAKVESGTGRSDELILYPHGLKLVSALAGGSDQPLRAAHTQNHVGFRGDGWEVLTRLIEGPYPDWRGVVPQDNDKALIVDRVTFMAAVRRMAIVAETQTHRIRVSLNGTTLSFNVANSGVGTGHEEIPVDYDGDPLEIGFNALYLLEVLKYIPTGEVRITFKAPERAATIHPVVPAEAESVITHDVLVMPLRLQ